MSDDTAAWLIRQAQQWEDQHAPQHLTIGLREAAAEIERLRAALREIASTERDSCSEWFQDIARAALALEARDE